MISMKAYRVLLGFSLLLLSACTTINVNDGQPHWDFDHNVQFRQTQLTENSYHIVIVATSKTRFNTLATFLLRHSKEVCHNYGYKLKILKGVQDYNAIKGAPNQILESLEANIECVNTTKANTANAVN